MTNRERDSLDDLFRWKLENVEVDTMPDDWEAIADRLPERRTLSWRRWYYGAAAAVLLALFAGGGSFFLSRRPAVVTTPVAVQKTQDIPGTAVEETPDRTGVAAKDAPAPLRTLIAEARTAGTGAAEAQTEEPRSMEPATEPLPEVVNDAPPVTPPPP
jgi:hypothetical protein